MFTLALLAAYVATLAFALHLLAAARRREQANGALDEAAGTVPRAALAPVAPLVGAVAVHPALERLAADVHDELEVDRVAIVMSDNEEPGVGRVKACFGPPKLLDTRIDLLPVPVMGPMSPFGAAALGIGDADEPAGGWTFAHLPITGAGELLGAVTVAGSGERRFTEHDLIVLERLARSRVPRFDRRHRALIPRSPP